jgi:hypothetical protein
LSGIKCYIIPVKLHFAGSEGNSRQILIIVLLIVSVGVGVWTYLPNLQGLLGPKASPATPAAPSAPAAPSLQSSSPSVMATNRVEAEEKKKSEASNVSGRLSLAALKSPSVDSKSNEESSTLNLVNEGEVQDSSSKDGKEELKEQFMAEKLNPIKVAARVPSKAVEKARMLAEKKKGDMENRTRLFLQDAKISGVRLAGKMSRLLFNGEVYQLGDQVGNEMKLTIQSMTPTQIIFEDEKGKVYPIHY